MTDSSISVGYTVSDHMGLVLYSELGKEDRESPWSCRLCFLSLYTDINPLLCGQRGPQFLSG